MKISFTREEIAEIVLAHVHRALTPDANRVEFVNSYGGDYAVVTFEPPVHEPELPLSAGYVVITREAA